MGAEQHQRTVPENDVTDLRAELPYSGGFAFCMMEKRRKRMKKESLKRWGLAALPGAVSVLLLYLAAHLPGFADIYRTSVFRPLSRAVSLISGLFPFSLSELLLAVLLFFGIAGFIRCLLGKLAPAEVLRHLFFAASVLLFLFTVFCGINYRAKPFSSQADLPVRESSPEELRDLCRQIAEEVNRRAEVLENEEIPPLSVQAACGQQAMEALGEEFPTLSGPFPRPKFLMLSRLLSIQQVTGIYSPFTVEANCNREIPGYNMPFTICHELSHLRGFMREDEANFIGFLAASRAEDPYFSYSGWLSGWVYAGNALAETDRQAFEEIHGMLCERARKDLAENNRFWEQFEGAAAETHERINDAYLRANGQQEGVKSYGRMVDLMLAWARVHPFS